ncbi:PREDICTED: cuticlin-1-like [Priapulus caudatus]|uniref:Cuticlin-1-like n=1 Tax=Priapulus caudatus TaxID=37621 RepID=A0ABM1EUL9_PRICU|nr:PREDICTED: cuticlin-1-like [Priapulus caudatus]XP_014675890.1 PREDICTED: cuticlin-1-like [Priapulus caudatus]XP_014675963.1 PREDICTED: cuticlin-1-like [Priapulus caudatus]XP_014676026.1 PREDICTED: cuticlin-1-like [Priapulus caudatus]
MKNSNLTRAVLLLALSCLDVVWAMGLKPKVTVKCSRPDAMTLTVQTPSMVVGSIYVKDQVKNPDCIVSPSAESTEFVIFFDKCGTKRENDIYTSTIVIQRHRTVVTADDVAYKVQCAFDTSPKTVLNSDVTLNDLSPTVINQTAPPAKVTMNVYDFVTDRFVTNLRLGEVYELEIDIANGRVYGGFVRDCWAFTGDGLWKYQLLDTNGCPLDAAIFGKAYVDDQSQNSGHYFLYMPFEAFKFAESTQVRFQCQLMMCRGPCEPFECFDTAGTSIGETFGRKKRDLSDVEEEVSIVKEIEVFDKESPEFAELLAQDENVKLRLVKDTNGLPWIVLTALLGTLLAVSIMSNIMFYSKVRRFRARSLKGCTRSPGFDNLGATFEDPRSGKHGYVGSHSSSSASTSRMS